MKAVGAQSSYEITTANAVCGVRGTEFETAVGEDGSVRVRVLEGSVNVAGDNNENLLGAGTEPKQTKTASAKAERSPKNRGGVRGTRPSFGGSVKKQNRSSMGFKSPHRFASNGLILFAKLRKNYWMHTRMPKTDSRWAILGQRMKSEH